MVRHVNIGEAEAILVCTLFRKWYKTLEGENKNISVVRRIAGEEMIKQSHKTDIERGKEQQGGLVGLLLLEDSAKVQLISQASCNIEINKGVCPSEALFNAHVIY